MRGQRSCYKKEQDKTSEKELSKTEVSNFPEKNFKAMGIKMLSELRRRLEEHSKNVNKELKIM